MHYAPSPGPYAQPPPYVDDRAGAFYRDAMAAPRPAPLGAGLRKVHLVMSVVGTLAFLGSVGLITAAIIVEPERPDESLLIGGAISFTLTILLAYAKIIVGLFWLHRAWAWLPERERYSKHWRSMITPGQAAWLLLIPYFQYYWMFVINCGLCDALDRVRVFHPTRTIAAAPKQLAIAAGIAQIVVPVPVGDILWGVFMRKVEQMTVEMSGG